MKLKLYKKISFLSTAFLLLILNLFLSASPKKKQGPVWSKMRINEAFISRATFIDHGEGSDSEFGWHIRYKGIYQIKGGLYSTMYFPCSPDEPIRLVLVELDFWSDDIIAGINVGKKAKRLPITMNGDFISFERTPFYPEKKSGSNWEKKGATPLKKDTHDSVSFLNGDYTDIYKLPSKKVLVMVNAERRLDQLEHESQYLTRPSYKTKRKNKFELFYSTRSSHLTIKGDAGSGVIHYSIYITEGPVALKKMMLKVGSKLNYKNHYDAARAFYYFDPKESVKLCRTFTQTNKSPNLNKLCRKIKAEEKWRTRIKRKKYTYPKKNSKSKL
jgi:hypothetical protein